MPYTVYDSGASPENYLGKIIKDKPGTIVIIDAVDFGAKAGEFRILEIGKLKTANLFSTYNASLSLTINYLQSNTKADIIVLIIQPKSIVFSDKLSPELTGTIDKLESWFCHACEKEG